MTRGILGGHQQDVIFGLLLEELDKFLMLKKPICFLIL